MWGTPLNKDCPCPPMLSPAPPRSLARRHLRGAPEDADAAVRGARALRDGRVVGGDPHGVEAAEGGQGGQRPAQQRHLSRQRWLGPFPFRTLFLKFLAWQPQTKYWISNFTK